MIQACLKFPNSPTPLLPKCIQTKIWVPFFLNLLNCHQEQKGFSVSRPGELQHEGPSTTLGED